MTKNKKDEVVPTEEHPVVLAPDGTLIPGANIPFEESEKGIALKKAVDQAIEEVLETAKGFVLQPGALYGLPMYDVVEGKGLEPIEGASHLFGFVKGATNDKTIPKQSGVILEELLAVLVHHLEKVNTDVPSQHGTYTIACIKGALEKQIERRVERAQRGVLGTYTK